LVAVEFLALLSFTVGYMADKGLWLVLAVLFLLSSLAYAAVAAGLKALLDRSPLRGRASLLAGLLAAGILHSAVFYLVVSGYLEELMVWETLGVVLGVSNIYGFAAIHFGNLGVHNLPTYAAVDALTLAVVPWVLLNLYRARRGRLEGFHDTLRGVAVAVALAVKPAEYLVLIVWLATLFYNL
jgi:hypothetical protein